MIKTPILLKIISLGFFIFLFSCKSREKLVYFQNHKEVENETSGYTPVLEVDDFLSVVVTSLDLETVEVFNTTSVNAPMGQNGYTQGAPAPIGYLVDSDGNINLPVIGLFHIAGLNRKEAILQLQDTLSTYAKDPIVQIQILNYKVTVIGDVVRPGTYNIPNERITILEALGLAGDLKMTGKRQNVLVIREENGKKLEYRVDLTSGDVFSSPVYYLKQNDVVYVEPNFRALSEASFIRSASGVFISTTSLIITIITLLTR
jgi:polysaccharide export outer membrane protein